MRLSALGVFIGVCPEWNYTGRVMRWLCVSFDKRGNWQSMSVHDCEGSAKAARSKLHRHHRNIKAERERRISKRRQRPPTITTPQRGREETE